MARVSLKIPKSGFPSLGLVLKGLYQNALFHWINTGKQAGGMSHNLRFLKFFNPAAVLLLGAILFPVLIVFAQDASLPSPVNLTPVERTWLDHNPDKLVLWFNTEFPPIEFISDKGEFIGMGADVIALVEIGRASCRERV